MAEEKLGDVGGKMTAMAGEVGHKANAQWDKLESIFEERTPRAMPKLGVPNAKALADLVDRVAALEKAVGIGPGDAAPAPKAKARAVKPAQAAAPAAAAPKPAARKATRPAARKTAAAAEAAPAPAAEAAAPVKTAIRRRRAAA